jgi:hypothetical protein
MKKLFIIFSFLLATGSLSFAQTSDSFVRNCALNAGTDAKYLKDFRIQLGKGVAQSELRYKANISLWKNTRYRFSMCNTEDSQGVLFLNIKDESNNLVLSSYDQRSGKTFTSVDFVCRKSGIYHISFDFTDGQPGSGVGIVSMIK